MGAHKSNFQEKVNWLVKHPELWKGWPVGRYTDDQIIERMRTDGLVSKLANNYDIMDFGKLIAAAREKLKHQ